MSSSPASGSSPGHQPAAGTALPRGPVAGRVGLSEYTSQRLAELRARRAEADSSDGYKSRALPRDPPPDPPSSQPAESAAVASPSRQLAGGPTEAAAAARGLEQRANGSSRAAVNGDSASSTSTVDPAPRSASAVSSAIRRPTESPARPPPLQQQQYESAMTSSVTSSGGSVVRPSTGSTNASVTSSSARAPTYTNSPTSQRRQLPGNGNIEEDDECLGFASLPEQVHRKAVKRGFDFTVMVVGESGLGKSTLLSCLFLNNELYGDRIVPTAEERISKTVEIEKKYMEIEERGVKLRLTIVDTPGFNDTVNANECWIPIRDYIDSQFDQYFKDETGLNRKNIKDYRVHCCLYFISPYGHGLRQIDVELMKCLQDRVNIVPIIAKSDTLTPQEIHRLKARVLEEIAKHKIHIYEFPECDSDEDEEFKRQDTELKAAIPFAVMGSSTTVEVNGRKVRGRLYPWGIVEVDNPSHSDFSKLRQFIISTHMQDLKDVTRDVHYENYRANHIQEQLVNTQRERSKLKRESGANFDVNFDTEKLLQQKEHEIQQMKQMLKMMQSQLATNKQNGQQAVNGVKN